MKKQNGYVLLVGGVGMDKINSGLTQIGFNLLIGNTPERFQRLVQGRNYHGVILADNIIVSGANHLDQAARLNGLFEILKELERLRIIDLQRVWLITRIIPQEAWKNFASFEMVHEIRKIVTPIVFASDVLTWLNVNWPLAKTKTKKL